MKVSPILQQEAKPSYGNEKNTLLLWGDAPRWEYSTAPLMDSDGHPVSWPNPGSGGHAMYFNDQQVTFLSKPVPRPTQGNGLHGIGYVMESH